MDQFGIFIVLIFGCISADKIYIPDLDKKLVGLTNVWVPEKACSNSRWDANENENKLEYLVCYSTDCVLKTTQFNITSVNTVFADIQIGGRFCTGAPNEPSGCTDYIDVGGKLGDVLNIPQVTVPWRKMPSVQDKVKKNKEYFNSTGVIEIETQGKNYISFRFNSRLFCGTLNKFNVFHYACPTVTESLVQFEQHNAPSKTKQVEEYVGKCLPNAVSVDASPLIMKCSWNGTEQVSGKCHCLRGFTKINKECKKCEADHFKSDEGNVKCTSCGINSFSNHERTMCKCMSGYFRIIGKKEKYAEDCLRLPSVPSNIQRLNVTDRSAVITWDHPSQISGNYTLSCLNCPKGSNIFPITTDKRPIKLSELGAYANYSLKLMFENSITLSVGQEVFQIFDLKTSKGVPGPVQNLKFKTQSDGSVELSWKAPFAKGSDIIVYVISYGDSTQTTSSTNYIIESDTKTKKYNIKVAARVLINGRELTGQFTALSEQVEIKGGVSLDLAIGGGVGAVLFCIIVGLIAFFVWRRRNPPYTQVVRMEDGTVKLPKRLYPGGKLYVDPTTYNDVDEAVQEFAYEIDVKSLKVGKLLGGGEFADVYKGSLFKNGKTKEVAIKTLKPNASKRDRDDFLSEAAIIGQFTDPNVISLEGVVLKERPHKIVLEFMANGALDKYLQTHDMQFTSLQLLGMARGVASGMKYLNELGFIHRDLAARNILVDEYRVCKVSDFGMSREIKVDETYDTQGGKIPVRWTAPESIQYKKFTTASDVWSYGILLWEIMSYGERPYWDWGNYEVLERLNQGYRLPPPMNCPKVIHDLMLHCWVKERTKRPKMVEIRDQLEKWIRNPDLLEATASVVNKTDENLDYTVLQTINKWLDAIGMGKYTENFIEQGFATPRQILELTLDDLEGLNIGPIGHRKKIFKAIQNTKAQVEQRHNSMSAGGSRKNTFSLPKKSSTS